MGHNNMNYATLVASRICHDLISPVGAISNGLELISLSGMDVSAELALINDSVENANARIRFFRVAFGHASAEQTMSKAQVMSILNDISRASRVTYMWHEEQSMPRREVRLALLAILCVECALPYGGRIDVTKKEDRWEISGANDRLNFDSELWDSLTSPAPETEHSPAHIQFAMLPEIASEMLKTITCVADEKRITLCIA